MTTTTVESAVSLFGERTKGKLANAGASGQPEDQLRSPFESLLQDMSALTALAGAVEAVGESSVASLKTRPDYAVTVKNALVGFVELKAPGKGADPRKFKDPHDKDQWERLRSLPNLLYTDGNSFVSVRANTTFLLVSGVMDLFYERRDFCWASSSEPC